MARSDMESRTGTAHRALPRILTGPLVGVLVLLLLPLVPLLLVSYLLYRIVLQVAIWIGWCSRGIQVLLVYSESPVWQDYIESNIIPRLPRSTVRLNWSERRKWRHLSLPVMAFGFFGGSREFNPLVVVFRPFRRTKTFRFWKAFKDYKHGRTTALEEKASELFEYLSRTGLETTD